MIMINKWKIGKYGGNNNIREILGMPGPQRKIRISIIIGEQEN